MSESRQALISWVNELLQTSYTKVEQMGTGAAYCQIIDSIYGDVPLGRVKFSANQEYEFVENFKILQNMFMKHKIDKPIDPPRLIKCRFQDNFELLQWMKRFWDAYFPGHAYDAVARRSGRPIEVPGAARPRSSASSARSSSVNAYRTKTGGTRVTAARPVPVAGRAGVRPGSGAGANANGHQVQELNRQLNDAKVLIDTAEKERDFYFSKLREIEVYIQQLEAEPGSEVEQMGTHIQSILYSTEEGFVGEEASGAQNHQGQGEVFDQVSGNMKSLHVDEEETF